MGAMSPIHWVIVAIVILLLFGPSRLAGMGKGLGEGIRSFKKGISDEEDELPSATPDKKRGEPETKAAPEAAASQDAESMASKS